MLSVGIHDNVVVSNATVNPQGTLEIEFTQPGSTDLMSALSGSGDLNPSHSVNIRVYKPEVQYFTEKRDGIKMLKILVDFRNVLVELLQVHIANPTIDLTKGIKMTQDTARTIFEDQTKVDEAYNYIVAEFVRQITPFIGKDVKFRVKLPRRSKKYAYPALPNYTPWVESMDVPKESSSLHWSAWEVNNGKNDPVPSTDTVSEADAKEQVDNLDDVFATS